MSENYLGIITENYYRELSQRIITENYHRELSSENYDLVYNITWTLHGKVEIYRDTGVSKNRKILVHF